MKEFILDDENLISGFFDELDINEFSIFEREVRKHFPHLSEKELTIISEDFYDEIKDAIGESGIRYDIQSEAYEEEEIDEATGLWGYFKFEINDEEKTKAYFEEELADVMKRLILQLVKKGRFYKNK